MAKAAKSGGVIEERIITRRRRPTTVAERAAERAEAEDADVMAQHEQIRETLGPDAAEAHYRIFRLNTATKQYEILAHVPMSDFDIETLIPEWGGGEFRAWVIGKDRKRKASGGDLRWRVAGPPRQPGEPGHTTDARSQLKDTLELLKAMREATGDSGGKGDGGDFALKMATAMASVQATTMTMMQNMMRPAAGDGEERASFEDRLETLFELADRLAERSGSGGGGVDPALGLAISTVGRGLERLAEAQRTRGALPALRVVKGAAPAKPNAPVTETAEAVVEGPLDLTKLRPLVQHLLNLAKRDRDPWAQAAAIYDELQDHPAVIAELKRRKTPEEREALGTELVAAFPAIAQLEKWFTEFFEALWGEVDEDKAPSDTGGDDPRVTAHEPAKAAESQAGDETPDGGITMT